MSLLVDITEDATMLNTVLLVAALLVGRSALHMFAEPTKHQPKAYTSEWLVLVVVCMAAAAGTTFVAPGAGWLIAIVAVAYILQMLWLGSRAAAPSIRNIAKWFEYVYVWNFDAPTAKTQTKTGD